MESDKEHPLFDMVDGTNPAGRGDLKSISGELAKGLAMYLGGLDDLVEPRGASLHVFRWDMVLNDGGTLQTLSMSSAEFTRTIGALIPVPLKGALIDTAGISVLESKLLSLRELIDMAAEKTGEVWPPSVRKAVTDMLERAHPTPWKPPDKLVDETSFTMKQIRNILQMESQSTLRLRLKEFGIDLPKGRGRSNWVMQKEELIRFLKWMADGNGKAFSKNARSALIVDFGIEP